MGSEVSRVLRFAVGDPEESSTIWSARTSPTKGDIYVTARGTPWAKLSLHETGESQFSFTREQLDTLPNQIQSKIRQRADGRHVLRFKRQVPIRSVALAFRIVIPETVTRKRHVHRARKVIRWIPRPDNGGATEIDFLLLPTTADQRALSRVGGLEIRDLGMLDVGEEGKLRVCFRQGPSEVLLPPAGSMSAPRPPQGIPEDGVYAFLFGVDDRGAGWLAEYALR